jgi:hypothetical protein
VPPSGRGAGSCSGHIKRLVDTSLVHSTIAFYVSQVNVEVSVANTFKIVKTLLTFTEVHVIVKETGSEGDDDE